MAERGQNRYQDRHKEREQKTDEETRGQTDIATHSDTFPTPPPTFIFSSTFQLGAGEVVKTLEK